MAEQEPAKTCFVATPVSGDTSSIRRATDGLLAAAVKPVLEKLGLTAIVPHEMVGPGSITVQIIDHILRADLVIANLTGLNPNVMYELAVRHAKRLPVVILAEAGTVLPFDVASDRVLFFVNDMQGAHELMPRLEAAIDGALRDRVPDNPVYRAAQDAVMKALAPSDSFQAYLLERLDRLDSRMSQVLARRPFDASPDLTAFDWYFYGTTESLHELTTDIVVRGLAARVVSTPYESGFALRFTGVAPGRRSEILDLISGRLPVTKYDLAGGTVPSTGKTNLDASDLNEPGTSLTE